jgi:hypothetical protein
MNLALAKHLWRSPAVRAALRKEFWRLLFFVVFYVGAVAASRSLRGLPLTEGLMAATVGAAAVILIWIISAIRTVRTALREHGLLER